MSNCSHGACLTRAIPAPIYRAAQAFGLRPAVLNPKAELMRLCARIGFTPQGYRQHV